MQLATHIPNAEPVAKFAVEGAPEAMQSRYSEYKIIRRNGAVVGFEPSKISIALTKAYIAVNGGQGAASARVREVVANLTDTVVAALMRRQPSGGTFHIEDIQDQVELALMRSGEHEVARAYVLYREQRSQERAKQREAQAAAVPPAPAINVTDKGKTRPLDLAKVRALVQESCEGLGRAVDPEGHAERPVRRRSGR
jgi:ribonucleoside-diphosphate reductase alpha chain